MKRTVMCVLMIAACAMCSSCAVLDTFKHNMGIGRSSSESRNITSVTSSAEESSLGTDSEISDTDSSLQQQEDDPDYKFCEYADENTPPSKMYDVSPIVNAYLTGDDTGLDERNKQILSKASQILDSIIKDGMDDYEKELAVHDYIVTECTYDSGALAAIPSPSENSEDPYGMLYEGHGICKGYTTTFRMFMGMLNIPCATIHSYSTEGREHAWNVIKIDGAWYYVDVTWDDPVPDNDGRLNYHSYFNLTRDEIAEDHILPDEAPVSDSRKDTFYTRNLYPETISSREQIEQALKEALEHNNNSIILRFEDMDLNVNSYKNGGIFEQDIKDACKALGCNASKAEIVMTDSGYALRQNIYH